jgi:hypothetical protein
VIKIFAPSDESASTVAAPIPWFAPEISNWNLVGMEVFFAE